MSANRKSPRQRKAILEAADGKCWLCGCALAMRDMTLDHIIPKSRGGLFTLANLRPAHRRCNELRGNALAPGHAESTVSWRAQLINRKLMGDGRKRVKIKPDKLS